MIVTPNFLSEQERVRVKEWITDSYYLDTFGDGRKAFSATFKTGEAPPLLRIFEGDANVYHFVGIVTELKGAIVEHIDEELVNYFRDHRDVEIRYPNTLVYYVDIDENMEGGQLLVDGFSISPQTNMLVQLDPKTPHAVAAVSKLSKPRIVLVCEQYKLLKYNVDFLDTPKYERG
jgi:hypothetical protein